MSIVYSRVERFKMFIRFFIEKYKPICCLCGGETEWESFYPKYSGLDRDRYAIHHKDHNRSNNKPENLGMAHRDCHRRHHRLEQIFKEQNKGKYVYTIFERIGNKISKSIYKV